MTLEKTKIDNSLQRRHKDSHSLPSIQFGYGKLAGSTMEGQNGGYGNKIMQSMSYGNGGIQLKKDEQEESVQLKQDSAPGVLNANNTGLPDHLKSGIENLSGMSMSDVKVHYNSDKPAQMKAHAYAQGTDIHVASGQEKHLPHEAWHVVQQKQGRVQPTMQMKGNVSINDDMGLEKEADVMGIKATQFVSKEPVNLVQGKPQKNVQNTPLQRVGKATPKPTGKLIPIEVQTQEELDLFKLNIERLRVRLATMKPEHDKVIDGRIEIAKAEAEKNPEIEKMEVDKKPYILQEAFQNLNKEDREYWFSLENHSDMMEALNKIVEKAEAGVESKGKPVNMKLFNIKIDTLLNNDDNILMINIQELMKLAGGNRDFLVARNESGKIPSSFGRNCGSTIMDAFNSTLDEMPGQAVTNNSSTEKICSKVNDILIEKVINACMDRFSWPQDFNDDDAKAIIEGAVNYKIGRDDNLIKMYTLMSVDAHRVIKEELDSVYTYEAVMELMRKVVNDYVNTAYNMKNKETGTAAKLLEEIWKQCNFNGSIYEALSENEDDYTYSLNVSPEQLEAIAVSGGIVELSESQMKVEENNEQEVVGLSVTEDKKKIDLFEKGTTEALPNRVTDVVKIEEGTQETDNLYFNKDTGFIGAKWGFFDAERNKEAREMYRDGLIYVVMEYIYARMPKANANRFRAQTGFQEISPYKLSHAIADLNSINKKVEAFLLMRI